MTDPTQNNTQKRGTGASPAPPVGEPHRVRIGLRTALLILILASVVPCAVLVHLTWWRTATTFSRELVDTLGTQITDAVGRLWWARVLEVQALSRTVHEGLAGAAGGAGAAGEEARDRVMLTAVIASPALSWLVFVPPDGGVTAIADAPDDMARLFRADRSGRVVAMDEVTAQTMAGKVLGTSAATGGGEQPPASGGEVLNIIGEAWVETARAMPEPGWVDVARTPDGTEPAVAYIDNTGGTILAAMIGHDRFAEVLGEIPVGRTGRSYVLGPDGAIVIASNHPDAPRIATMDEVALAAGRLIAARPAGGLNVTEKARLSVGAANYAVGLSPLWFKGWQLAVIVPEAEFLGRIDETIMEVTIGLGVFVVLAGAVGVAAARGLVASPIGRVVGDLGLVERFELDAVPRRHSRLFEIDRLSEAIVRMSAGLADFAKFIPTDLVRVLVADGVRAEPGGTRREITVLFADLAGFTGLSERLGDDVVPVVSRYLEAASQAIAAEGGTVDKFIGDAVMAFWNAPRPDGLHATNACRAALGIVAAVEALGLDLEVRIGIQTGPAIVGNIGSTTRLNYTALGDTVNQASRFEGVNKVYGTTILIGAATRAAAGDAIAVREVDTVAVYGRAEGVTLYELIGRSDASQPVDWVSRYEAALAAYRDRRFDDALAELATLDGMRPHDGPARRLGAAVRALVAAPPGPDWSPVTSLDMK